MSFTYKNQSAIYLPFIIIGAFFISIGLMSLLLFTLFNSLIVFATGEGISPFCNLLWLGVIAAGAGILISALSFRKRPFLSGSSDGLTVCKGWKSYSFSWQEIQSITHQKKKVSTFSKRKGFHYRPYYDYLLIDSANQPPLSLEVTYIEGGVDHLLEVIRSQFKNVQTEDLT